MNIRTRIAPSPTGFPHLATVPYQAMFDFALAKKHGGQFVVRIEDTDRSRFVEGAEQIIYDALSWFGLAEDESPRKGGSFAPYRQSERLEIYKKYVMELVDKGHAYYCFCTRERLEKMRQEQQARHEPPMYDKHCLHLTSDEVKVKLGAGESYVIRMKVPEGEELVLHDLIVGDVKFDSNTIDHQVLFKSDGYPTYHLAVVVDDYLMKITHVIRGREWISSTPKHILLYRYFGWEVPQYAHLPLILNADGKGKLSKRHGHAAVTYYQKLGYLPEAILNYLSNSVWHHPEGKEIYPFSDFIKYFELKDISSQGPRFDLAKLDWMNGVYIRNLDTDEFFERLQSIEAGKSFVKEDVIKLFPLVRDRLVKLSDFWELVDFYFEKEMKYGNELIPKSKSRGDVADVLGKLRGVLEGLSEWNTVELEKTGRKFLEDVGWKAGELFMTIRVAVTGKTVTPPLFETMEVLGKEETLRRVESAFNFASKGN